MFKKMTCKKPLFFLLFVLTISIVTVNASYSIAEPSKALAKLNYSAVTTESLNLKNARITQAELVTNDVRYPAYYLIRGKVNERTGIDGKTYAIGFEMRLPLAWSGRFLHQVNGGNDGVVVPAEGDPRNVNAVNGISALARGFAVLSTDAGHDAKDPANAGFGLAQSNAFGLDPQARSDYGYAATGTMVTVAKKIIRDFYGRDPSYSYMFGCSNGGRHGMVAASRYPEHYDGILVGNPGHQLPKAAVQHAWDVQSFMIANSDIRKSFSREDMQLVASKVVEKCDSLDGLEDGLVADLRRCQEIFKISDLKCSGEKRRDCLNAEQVRALDLSMGGPKNSAGQQLYSSWPYDGGMGAGNWRFWKIESGVPPWNNMPLIAVMGAGSLSYIFTVPPTKTPGDPASLLNFLTKFDFDKDAPKIFAKDDTFKESPMEFMTPPDVANPKLEGFKVRGGKMIIYQGQSDAVFSTNDIIDWHKKLAGNYGGNPSDFVRLFLVPGMAHCRGGPATDQFDGLSALMTWVEAGQAPDRIIASVDPLNRELPEAWDKKRTRPLCPWPKIPRFIGGDKEKAESFKCE
jgi:feruloyl esterase